MLHRDSLPYRDRSRRTTDVEYSSMSLSRWLGENPRDEYFHAQSAPIKVTAGDKAFAISDKVISTTTKLLQLTSIGRRAQSSSRNTGRVDRQSTPDTLQISTPLRYHEPSFEGTDILSSCSGALSNFEEDKTESDSEVSAWVGHARGGLEWDTSGADPTPIKLLYIRQLLVLFKHRTSHVSHQEGSGGRSTSKNGKHQASSASNSNQSGTRPSKRAKIHQNDDDDGDIQGHDDGGNDPDDVSASILGDKGGPSQLLACPFVKRYPNRYYKCYSHKLKDISRVKQHLFRSHLWPIYCPNCSETFSGEDTRDGHIRAMSCPRRPPGKWEGITTEQRKQLKKRSLSKNSVVENWNAIYMIIFPGDPLPENPYLGPLLSAELRLWRDRLHSETPSAWNEILRTHLPEHLQPHLEELQSFHRSFYPQVLARLFENWVNGRSLTATSPPSQLSSTLIPREAEAFAETPSTETVNRSQSPMISDSVVGRSDANGSQTEYETPAAGSNTTSAPHTELQKQLQQQEAHELRGPNQPFHDSYNTLQGSPSNPRPQNMGMPSDALLGISASSAFDYDAALTQFTHGSAGSRMTMTDLEQLPGLSHESDAVGSYDQTNYNIDLSPSDTYLGPIDFSAWTAWEQQH